MLNGSDRVVGGDVTTATGAHYDPVVAREIGVPSPIKITINSVDLVQPNGSIDFDVEIVEAIADISTMKIRAYLIEDNVFWCCGFGGEDTWLDVTRDVMPEIALTVSQVGQVQNVVHNFAINPSWAGAQLSMVAFVQRNSDKYVIQATNTLPKPQYSMRYFAKGSHFAVIPSFGTQEYEDFAVFNMGTSADQIRVELEPGTLPQGWTCAFTDGTNDYTGFVDLNLNAGESRNFRMKVTPTRPGYANPEILLTSVNLPGVERRISYSFVTDDVQVLLVDDDGADTYDNYHTDALGAYGASYGVVHRSQVTSCTAAQLQNFPVVVWQTGLSYPTLDANDRAALGTYLDAGGKLFITGQEIGWELNDLGGAAYAWYQNYLHATFVLDDTNRYNLTGVGGDPISNGMAITIQGGDGANNQVYPDAITPINGASTIFTYNGTAYNGGLRVDTGVYKVVYLGFGYEAISTQANRRLLMQRIMEWFGLVPAAAEDASVLPSRISLTAAPNPASPRTTLTAELPSSGPVRLDIYALDGSRVRTLVDRTLTAGRHAFVWDGRRSDGDPAPTGVYFYRLKSASGEPSGKLVLTR
jgi:hypothetical protein